MCLLFVSQRKCLLCGVCLASAHGIGRPTFGMMRPGSSNGSARSTPPPLKPPTTAYALGRDSSGGAAGNAAANASQSPTSPRRRRVHGEVDVSVHLALDVRPCIQPLPRTDGELFTERGMDKFVVTNVQSKRERPMSAAVARRHMRIVPVLFRKSA